MGKNITLNFTQRPANVFMTMWETHRNLKNHLQEDFLLLESDIIYEKRALAVLINHHENDVILASGETNSGDEVFIEVDKDNCLLTLSKSQSDLSDVYGELVGISKISLESYQEVCKWAKNNIETAKQIHYEEALAKMSDKRDIYVEKIEDLVWTEIDNEEHFRRAFYYIYPELIEYSMNNIVNTSNPEKYLISFIEKKCK